MFVVRRCMVFSIAARRTRQVGQSGLAAGEGGAANGRAHGGRRADGGTQGARTEECGGHCECVNVCRWVSVVLRFGRCCWVEEELGQHDMNRSQKLAQSWRRHACETTSNIGFVFAEDAHCLRHNDNNKKYCFCLSSNITTLTKDRGHIVVWNSDCHGRQLRHPRPFWLSSYHRPHLHGTSLTSQVT